MNSLLRFFVKRLRTRTKSLIPHHTSSSGSLMISMRNQVSITFVTRRTSPPWGDLTIVHHKMESILSSPRALLLRETSTKQWWESVDKVTSASASVSKVSHESTRTRTMSFKSSCLCSYRTEIRSRRTRFECLWLSQEYWKIPLTKVNHKPKDRWMPRPPITIHLVNTTN